jgi:ectoine hydroxylase-related dioxygenase (phytanoyl-CoA dioxygenase family)
MVTEDQVVDYERDGAVCLRGLFSGWVDRIIEGIEHNMREPGPHAAENLNAGESGRFFDDYCNWQRIPALEELIRESPAVSAAAALMRSESVQVFHDHVLVKEPGTSKATPWHQDAPYYFVDGMQTVSFWIPVDPVVESTLRVIAGSHRWEKMVLPVRWLNDESFYPDKDRVSSRPRSGCRRDAIHGAGVGHAARRRRGFSLPHGPRRSW